MGGEIEQNENEEENGQKSIVILYKKIIIIILKKKMKITKLQIKICFKEFIKNNKLYVILIMI